LEGKNLKVSIYPEGSVYPNVPVRLKVFGESNPPFIHVSGLGGVTPKKLKNYYFAEFWAKKAGQYKMTVKGQQEIWHGLVSVDEPYFFSFSQEIGLLLAIGLCFIGGLVLWMRKIKKT
jgi:hypothetical protein